MKQVKLKDVRDYIQRNIGVFHENRLKSLESTNLPLLLRKKNPYLFRAKNILTAQELVTSFLDARLSSSEEEIFGDFMEDLAIYIAQKKLAASKSSSDGIDFHYRKGKEIFVISIKSGLNWGNSSQWKALESDFKKAQRVLLQSSHVNKVHCMLGVCYGKAKKTLKKGFIAQICGQEFWHMVSGSPSFYKDIIEPLGHHAKELNENFKERKARLINKLTKEFLNDFCTNDGTILWDKVVEYNSGNMKK